MKDKLSENQTAEERFKSRVLNASANSAIPDANKIHEARKKREEMRKLAQDPAYIAMNRNGKNRNQNRKTGSRIEGVDSGDENEQITRMKGLKKYPGIHPKYNFS